LVKNALNNTRQASAQACSNWRVSFCLDVSVKRFLSFFQWLFRRFRRSVPAARFYKQPLSYQAQVRLLRSRGLVVADEPAAEHCLAHHNYYRLSAYRYPLSEPTNAHQFLPGTTFEQLWRLYCFDRSLRELVNEAAQQVEISARARFSYEYGHAYGALSYADPSLFKNRQKHAYTLKKIDEEIRRSKEDFILHFKNSYGMTRPPIWAACEVMSFGNISKLYEFMLHERDRKRLASTYGLSIADYGSLIHHLSYVRNICAHHSRLWNRKFTITLSLPKKQPPIVVASVHPLESRRVYNTLVLLAHMTKVIEPGSTWHTRVRHLVEAQTFPVATKMGFPVDWQARPIWQP
jgi:abortive infection bacteriophage resistance protein